MVIISFLRQFCSFFSVAKNLFPKTNAYCSGLEATRSKFRLRYRELVGRGLRWPPLELVRHKLRGLLDLPRRPLPYRFGKQPNLMRQESRKLALVAVTMTSYPHRQPDDRVDLRIE